MFCPMIFVSNQIQIDQFEKNLSGKIWMYKYAHEYANSCSRPLLCRLSNEATGIGGESYPA